jgi:RNA polymerase sigma-70 factor (ECF subfamily)
MNKQEGAEHVAASASRYEAALIACAAGNRDPLADIYLSEGHRLRAVARRIVQSYDGAEDVLHDAFAQILRDAGNFDPAIGSARAWIYTIVRNTAVKSRQKAAREIVTEDEALNSLRDHEASLAAPAGRLAEATALRRCLEELDPRRRTSLILAFVDGRTHTEVADYLGVPVGTVKAWIRRELIALRKRLE